MNLPLYLGEMVIASLIVIGLLLGLLAFLKRKPHKKVDPLNP